MAASVPLRAQEKSNDDGFGDFFNSADDQFKKLKKEADEQFEKMKKETDKQFGELLNNAWKEFELARGIKPDTEPKPSEVPEARPSEVPAPSEEKEEIKPAPSKLKVIPKLLKLLGKEGTPLSLNFYDTPFTVTYDERIKVRLPGKISENSISTFWEILSTSNYQTCLDQVLQIKNQLKLNDWGYCLLLDSIAEGIYGGSSSERNIFVWFMLLKSGFDARIGFNNDKVFLLLPSLQIVYNTSYYVLGNDKYFVTSINTPQEDIQKLFTYDGKYKDANTRIDYTIHQTPDITKKFERKEFSFTYSGKQYNLWAEVNQNIIDYFKFYPQANYDIYFQAPLSQETSDEIINEMKPIIQNVPEDEAVNILLRFVQSAFTYKTDESQFGREKPMFPEETLYYPYSDCEDRSFLFAFLINRLLGLSVVGLDYPGHVATAVKFTKNIDGDFISFNNERYIICDPTYINAHYGECMPQYKNVSPGIITFSVQ
jgi:hypothetical protein